MLFFIQNSDTIVLREKPGMPSLWIQKPRSFFLRRNSDPESGFFTSFVYVKGDEVDIKDLLKRVELFDGLTEADLDEVAAICTRREFKAGEILAEQNEIGAELFVVSDGLVEVTVRERTMPRVVVNLGAGQIIGEMSLVDRGPRSATVRAVNDTVVQAIQHNDFQQLCQRNTHIGYQVMLNLAADLSFKLRHRNLSEEKR